MPVTHIKLHELDERKQFALSAAQYFADNSDKYSYSEGCLQEGELLALRWGLGEDCVLVLKIDEYAPLEIYEHIVP